MRTTRSLAVRAGLSLAACAALSLTGCAGLPDREPQREPRPAAAYASMQSFAAPATAWPLEAWWHAYGDPQLDRLVDEALAGSPSIAVADARLRRAAAAAGLAQAGALPQVGASASITGQKASYEGATPRAVLPSGWKDYGAASIDFSWEIDFWGRNRAAIAAATSNAEAVAADAAQARLVLAAAIAQAYAELARLHAARTTAIEASNVRARTADLFARRQAHGLETTTSVRQAQARQAVAEGDVQSLEEQLLLQRHRLAALVGAGPDRALSITEPRVDLALHFGLPPDLAADLLGRRPDVVAARLRAASAGKRIDQASAEFYPNVNLAAVLGVQSLGLGKLARSGSDYGSVGPAISLPIFDGGRLRANLRGAEADYAEAVASYDGTVLQAMQDVADAATSLRALAGEMEKIDRAVEASRAAWQDQDRRYQGGLAGTLDVLSTQDTLLANERSQSDLHARGFALHVALQRALGGGFGPKDAL